jgi:bifunctional non-homologous end joining protein LigD
MMTITTPRRPVFPRLGFDKLALARYYAAVAPWMLPYVQDRPLTLVRCEKGASRVDALRSECKFLRHEPGWHRWAPASVRRVKIQEQKKLGEYLVIDSVEGLLALAQGDVLEVHCWNATTAHLEHPDRFVLDLDPAAGVAWKDLVDAAKLVRARLREIGLKSWPKLTGGKGLHVVVPFLPELGWDTVYAVTKLVAESLVRDHPERFTVQFGKTRRTGKILIDYKRNHRAAVAVAAYSARALPQGSVSAPVSWKELERIRASDQYTVKTVVERLEASRRDPWAGYWRCTQSLERALRERAAR